MDFTGSEEEHKLEHAAGGNRSPEDSHARGSKTMIATRVQSGFYSKPDVLKEIANRLMRLLQGK
jgi:hypothetical protein